MDHRDKIFIGLMVAFVLAVGYMATRPVQVDISPAPDKPLSNATVGESEDEPATQPNWSRYRGAFLYPLAFMRPLPITSTSMR